MEETSLAFQERFRQKTKGLCGVLVLCFFFLGLRCFYIQVHQYHKFKALADQHHQVKVPIPGERGKIYSQDGTLYALSMQSLSLGANPKQVQNEKEVAFCLGKILQKDPEKIKNAFQKKDKNFVWIQRKLSEDQVQTIEGLGIEGLEFRTETTRFYPRKEELCHLLGFTNIDNEGIAGLELTGNQEISGKDGYRWTLRDAGQRSIEVVGKTALASLQGANIRLTLESTIQFILEEELEKLFKTYRPESLTGIVMDPQNGAILALGCFPRFDPNRFQEAPTKHLKNHALLSVYEPGSTFKSFVAAAVLEEKLFQVDDVIFCENGRFVVEGRRPLHDHHSYDDLKFWEVIAKSSNIGCAKMALRLGEDRFYHWIKKFGFGETLQDPFLMHSKGKIQDLKNWSKISLISIQMGHEILATPLQLIRAYTSFANGGYLVKPYAVEQIHSPQHGILHHAKKEREKVLSESTVREMNFILSEVFQSGTARKSKLKGYTLAGKTGTAEKVNPETKRYYKDRNIASFVAFGPIGRSRLITMVVADDPRPPDHAHGTGGQVAAPAVAAVMERALHYLGVPEEPPWSAEEKESFQELSEYEKFLKIWKRNQERAHESQ
jgi:cell division protein FtsI (penicillin-binding protein 3)